MARSIADPSLVADLILFFEAWERGPLRPLWMERRRRLLARLTAQTQAAPPDVIAATRARWAGDYRVMVPDIAEMRIDRDGIWLAGWLLAGEGLPGRDPVDPDRMAAALATLPVIAREVFMLHRRDDIGFDAIGIRLGITAHAAQAAFSDALLRLDAALDAD